MQHALAAWVRDRFHYSWVVVGVVFLALVASAGVSATLGVLLVPLEKAFGWPRVTISLAMSLALFLFGFMGPFAAAAMQTVGVRATMLFALVVLTCATGSSYLMTAPWHLVLTWGLLAGIGTGSMVQVLSATIATRWFVVRRGMVMGFLTGSVATGQLIFLPTWASLATNVGWQSVVLTIAAICALIVPLVYLLLPEHPKDVGLNAYGAAVADAPVAKPTGNPIFNAFAALRRGARRRDFWLLAGGFFVCGLSTNGLIGAHMIAACFDRGIAQVTAASLVAVMGAFNLVGTMLSGWLSDRLDNRWLLFWYYGLRGLSLLFLPYSGFTFYGLSLFAVFYGLDWLATVPPTVRLATDAFGKQDAPILFGWIFSVHQVGAAAAAFGAGYLRTSLDRYLEAFLIAGVACAVAAVMSLMIGRRRTATFEPALAT